jgi:hypothetical protein
MDNLEGKVVLFPDETFVSCINKRRNWDEGRGMHNY